MTTDLQALVAAMRLAVEREQAGKLAVYDPSKWANELQAALDAQAGMVSVEAVRAVIAEAYDLSPHSDTIDACSHRDPFEAYHMGFEDCREAVEEVLAAAPAGPVEGGGK